MDDDQIILMPRMLVTLRITALTILVDITDEGPSSIVLHRETKLLNVANGRGSNFDWIKFARIIYRHWLSNMTRSVLL